MAVNENAAKARILASRSTTTAARVKDLVALGYVINSSRITTVDADSFEHRNVALYELVSEPEA